MTPDQLQSLRRRAHIHSDRCYGNYEPCGEHHAHDNTCGSRSLICLTREDRDLCALIADYDRVCQDLKDRS